MTRIPPSPPPPPPPPGGRVQQGYSGRELPPGIDHAKYRQLWTLIADWEAEASGNFDDLAIKIYEAFLRD